MLQASSCSLSDLSEFFGEDILIWLMLAVGGALTIGTATALIKPKAEIGDDELERPPLGRSLVQIAIGLIVVIWAAVSLFS